MSGPLSGAGPQDLEPRALLDAVAEGAAKALPDAGVSGTLVVERERSLADRLSGRPGRVSSVRLSGPDVVLTLRADAGGRRLSGEAARVVSGVAISRRAMPVGQWLTTFSGQVAALAAEAAGETAAASAALSALGVRPAGFDLVVDDADVTGGLRSLSSRVSGVVPAQAAAAVGRIADLLLDTLPRVAGGGEAEVVVRAAATAYLPDTVRAYAALPPDWARTHVLGNGCTAEQTLLTQLAALESAAQGMRDAAVEQDASALLVNGIFLSDRFATSSLDLPR